MYSIQFEKKGHDDFIDFIKAYSILVVIFCHGFPLLNQVGYPIWGAEIPLFFLVQVFHCYKREPKPINWKMIGKRIVLPFIVIEAIIFGLLVIGGGGKNSIRLLTTGLNGGGFGPGSYYPWIYLQMAVLIPLMRPICEKLGKWQSLLVFIIISEAIEIVCSITNLPDSVYRLLCLRYIMLIWFGWMWVQEGIKLNITTILFSFFSLFVNVYMVYYGSNLEPLFYNTNWITHRWISYFWVSWLLVVFLYLLFMFFKRTRIVMKFVKLLSAASYEIFLVQMIYYTLVSARHFGIITWFCLAFVISVLGGFILHNVGKKYYYN